MMFYVNCEISSLTFSENYFKNQNVFYCSCLLHFIGYCVEVLRPSQPNGVMSSAVSLPNHMFTGQA